MQMMPEHADHATDDDLHENTIVDYAHVYPASDDVSPAVGKLITEKNDVELVKPPSFVDVLVKSNPNLLFQAKTTTTKKIKRVSNNVNYIKTNLRRSIIDLRPLDAVAARSAERKLREARSAKDGIQQRLELKEAASKEAKDMYEAAASDEKALRSLLKAKNVEISEAQSELKSIRKSGAVADVLKETQGSGTKTVLLSDGMKSIHDALHSSGIGIHDLDWAELSYELLKPMKKEALSLKEDIQRAEGFTKASKKNYDNRVGELKVLKAELREAEGVVQEVNRQFMMLQKKDISEENGDFMADEEEKNQGKDASDLPCIGQMDLGNQVNESSTEDTGSDSVKTTENKNICTDQTSEPEVVFNSDSEHASVKEQGRDIKEVDDASNGDLVEEVQSTEIEALEIVTTNGEIRNGTHALADHQLMSNEKKKPNKRERRALAKAQKEKGNPENEDVTTNDEIHNGAPALADHQLMSKEKKKPNKRERRALAKAQKEKGNPENEEVSIEKTMDSQQSSNTEHQYSEQVTVSEQEWNNDELDDDGCLSEDECNEEEEQEKAELSETEIAEGETTIDENNKYRPRKTYKNKRKQKKLTRKAARAKAAELRALQSDGTVALSDRLVSVMKLPQVRVAISLMVILLVLWSVL